MHTRRQFGMVGLGLAALAVLLGLSSPPAQAGFLVTLTQQGNNVVANGSGSIDLTGLTISKSIPGRAAMTPSVGSIESGPALLTGSTFYSGFTGPKSFGPGGGILADSGSGDLVSILGASGFLTVPVGYVSGNSLSDTSTYLNTTFSGLGATPGTYVWTWGTGAHADSFTLQVGPATAAPEPATLTQLATGALGLLGYGIRRRRRAAA